VIDATTVLLVHLKDSNNYSKLAGANLYGTNDNTPGGGGAAGAGLGGVGSGVLTGNAYLGIASPSVDEELQLHQTQQTFSQAPTLTSSGKFSEVPKKKRILFRSESTMSTGSTTLNPTISQAEGDVTEDTPPPPLNRDSVGGTASGVKGRVRHLHRFLSR